MHTQEKLVTINKKYEKREVNREKSAEKAAQLERAIEKELLQRLKAGTVYKDIYNFDQQAFEKVLDDEQVKETEYNVDEEEESYIEDDSDAVGDLESVDDEDELEMLENEEDMDGQEVEDAAEYLSDGDGQQAKKKGKLGKKRPRVQIGYDDDDELQQGNYELEYEPNEAPRKSEMIKKRQKVSNRASF